MKISSNLKQNLQVAARWAFVIGSFGLMSYCSYDNQSKAKDKNMTAKEYVKQKAPEKYEKLNKKEKNWSETIFWDREAKIVEDSIKLDSIAKANYALGMQAIRDSLSQTNKK